MFHVPALHNLIKTVGIISVIPKTLSAWHVCFLRYDFSSLQLDPSRIDIPRTDSFFWAVELSTDQCPQEDHKVIFVCVQTLPSLVEQNSAEKCCQKLWFLHYFPSSHHCKEDSLQRLRFQNTLFFLLNFSKNPTDLQFSCHTLLSSDLFHSILLYRST